MVTARLLWCLATCAAVLLAAVSATSRRPLGAFLSHHEPVNYDLDDVMRHHRRITRSNQGPREMSIKFEAMGRSFNLLLLPDSSLFHEDAILHSSEGPVKGVELHTSTYTGHDLNHPGSHVHGNMLSGVFDGIVYTQDETFYIEPAHRYTRDISAHSVIYRHSDINGEALNGAKCGLESSAIHENMKQAKRSILTSVSGDSVRSEGVRRKRQEPKVRCWLNVTGDYKFFKEVTKMVNANDNAKMSVAASLLVGIIQGASTIFQKADFNLDAAKTADNIQFGIRAMTIETQQPLSGPFKSEFIGVEAFLTHHSEIDSSSVCLSYRFTYRDFDGGVLGLAYVAQRGSSGGICQRRLNTGIVTLLNYGRRIPTAITVFTMAHEAGHNFGSQHDPSDPNKSGYRAECDPSGRAGKYVMYAFANDGSRDNNDDFSLCSREMMGLIISDRAEMCFVEAGNLCQNGLLDDKEACDCGDNYDQMTGMCNLDKCCNGMNCTLVDGVQCSPDAGDCCNSDTCMFYKSTDDRQCATETDCSLNTTCNGLSAACPEAAARLPRPGSSFVLCNDESLTCVGNMCNGSFCVVLGAESCSCEDEEKFCHVCCTINDECVSTIDIAKQNRSEASLLPGKEGRFLPIGHPCNDFRGYCDSLQNCFIVDNEGALERLANIFFNRDQINAALDWIRDHWWAPLVAGVGLLVGIFFIILIVHLLLPRPEHMKQRAERRKTIRRSRKQGHIHPDTRQHGHEMKMTN